MPEFKRIFQSISIEKKTFFLLFLALAVLRMTNIMGCSQGDDLYYTQLAYRASTGNFRAGFIFDIRWLVFLPTALLYNLFGANDFTSLFFPVTVSLINVFFAYNIVKEESNHPTALLATAIYGSIPLVMVYGNFLQVAPFIEFSTLGAIFFLQRAIKKDKIIFYILSGFFIGLISMCRTTGLFIAPMMVLYLIYRIGFSKKSIVLSALLAATSLVPLVVQGSAYYFIHNDFFYRFVISKRGIEYQNSLTGVDPRDTFFYLRTFFTKKGFADYRYFGAVGFTVFPATLYVIFLKFKGSFRREMIFPVWFLAYLLMMTFIPTSISPLTFMIRNIRYAIVFMVPATAVIAAVLIHLSQKGKAMRYIVAGAALFFISLNIFYTTKIAAPYKRRHRIQKSAALRALKLAGGKQIYLIDKNIDRRLRYYSGYKIKNYRVIGRLNQIQKPGYLLVLKLHHNKSRYRMPKNDVRKLVKNPPNNLKYVGNYDYFYVYEAAPHGNASL